MRINLTPPADLEELFRIEPHDPIDEELAAATQRLWAAHVAAQPSESFYEFIMRQADQQLGLTEVPKEPEENHHFL